MKIDIRYDDAEVRRGLNRLLRAARDLSPAMREIAGHLVDSAEENLRRQAAPDGTPWKPLADRTLADRRRQNFGVRPILERSGDLFGTIQADHDKRSAAGGRARIRRDSAGIDRRAESGRLRVLQVSRETARRSRPRSRRTESRARRG